MWTFVTGDREEINSFALIFLLTLVRGEAAEPGRNRSHPPDNAHDRERKMAKSYTGSEWTRAELIAELEKPR